MYLKPIPMVLRAREDLIGSSICPAPANCQESHIIHMLPGFAMVVPTDLPCRGDSLGASRLLIVQNARVRYLTVVFCHHAWVRIPEKIENVLESFAGRLHSNKANQDNN